MLKIDKHKPCPGSYHNADKQELFLNGKKVLGLRYQARGFPS